MQSAGSNRMSGGSFMDSNNNDLIGLGSEPTMSHISKVNSPNMIVASLKY